METNLIYFLFIFYFLPCNRNELFGFAINMPFAGEGKAFWCYN